jgi:hypothetical protein
MQLALRRGFGYSFDPFRGMRGLGQDEGGVFGTVTGSDPIPILDPGPTLTTPLPTEPIIPVGGPPGGSLYDQLIAQGVNPTDAAAYDPLGACAVDPNCSMPPGVLANIIPAGTPGGQMTGGVPTPAQLAAAGTSAFTPAQIAAAIKAGTLIAATTATQGRPACPSGVAYPTGQCMPVSTGIFGGTPLVAGVSNTTLGIAALIVFALLMMGGGGGRRR